VKRSMLGCFWAFSLAIFGCGDGDALSDEQQQNDVHARPDADKSDDETDESDADDRDARADADQKDGSADQFDASADDLDADGADAPSDANGHELDGHTPEGSTDGSDAADGQEAGSDGGTSDGAASALDASADAEPHDGAAQPDGASADGGPSMDAGDAAPAHDAAMADAQPEAGSGLTYYRDAKPIIDAKCKPCHHRGGIAPFPLTSYAEVEPFKSLIRSDVAAGIMPPWQASGPLGVFVGDRRLSEQQKSTLLSWIDQGALAGDPNDAAPEIPPDRRELGRVDLSLPIQPYTQGVFPDDYRCFVLEWPYRETKYVTGISIEPDRTQSVHHAILYLEPPENAASVRAQDRAALGSGFQCFSNLSSLNTWLTSYEPGGYGQSLPDELGFEVRPGSVMVLQVHYNSFNGVGADASRVDFEIADRVERVGDVVQLVDSWWILVDMSIPAGAPDVVHRWRGRPSELSSSVTYDIQWVDLHMHTLGSRGSVSIARSGLPRRLEPLLQIPDWEFNWQQTYVFQQPVTLNPGDELEVECHFDNTAANQMIVDGRRLEPRNVNWGEATTDEMCLGNVLVSPVR
jgi:hypothetical protein